MLTRVIPEQEYIHVLETQHKQKTCDHAMQHKHKLCLRLFSVFTLHAHKVNIYTLMPERLSVNQTISTCYCFGFMSVKRSSQSGSDQTGVNGVCKRQCVHFMRHWLMDQTNCTFLMYSFSSVPIISR